jgi:hypothetical protein
MEIEEVIKIYDFLGRLNLIGFISICILLSAGILAVFLPFKERPLISDKLIVWIIVLINVALISLFIQAKSRIPYLQLANRIKQDFVYYNFKQKSFNLIRLPDDEDEFDSVKKLNILKKLPELFPDEFLLIQLKGNSPLTRNGIAIIDAGTVEKIDKQIDAKSNLTSHLIVSYMNAHGKDTISMTVNGKLYANSIYSYPSLRDLDTDGWKIGQFFATTLVGKNDLQPIYDTIDFTRPIIGFTIPKLNRKK